VWRSSRPASGGAGFVEPAEPGQGEGEREMRSGETRGVPAGSVAAVRSIERGDHVAGQVLGLSEATEQQQRGRRVRGSLARLIENTPWPEVPAGGSAIAVSARERVRVTM
jgi:hypothetical protein